jgi:hypothetical protein
MESEPIFSIPIYVVAIASFVLILLIIFLAVLITRKKVRKQIT